MKVLWICNLILPEIAGQLGLPSIPKEGWVAGLLDSIASRHLEDFHLAIAFPVSKSIGACTGKVLLTAYPDFEITYYGFVENTVYPERYDLRVEKQFLEIYSNCCPDVVHIFGTEFGHTLAAAKAWNEPERLLIGMQGVCTQIADHYMAHLPGYVRNGFSFRDLIRLDTLRMQKHKFAKRGDHERKAISLAGHVAGRTDFDYKNVKQWNPEVIYHHGGESLRPLFYEGRSWENSFSNRHRIFFSQADYPLKGFHYLLMAAGELMRLEEEGPDGEITRPYEDLEIYVAGQSLVNYESIKDRIKISGYGSYLRTLISREKLTTRVHILGRLSQEEMVNQYCLAGVYVCASACENSPNSLAEAMMLGVPSVASRVGGVASMFSEEDGYLFSLEKDMSLQQVVENLKNAILQCWENPEETENRRLHGMARALADHDRDQIAQEFLDIYQEMSST